MKKKKNRYRLSSRYWYQTALTYAEDTAIRQTVKESGLVMPANEEEFPLLIDKLYTEKPEAFKRMIGIILKPDNSSWRWLWNKLHRPVDSESLVDGLTRGEIAIVLADFFTIRLNWMFDLLNSKTESRLQTKHLREMERMSKQLKRVSILQDKIMPEQKK